MVRVSSPSAVGGRRETQRSADLPRPRAPGTSGSGLFPLEAKTCGNLGAESLLHACRVCLWPTHTQTPAVHTHADELTNEHEAQLQQPDKATP